MTVCNKADISIIDNNWFSPVILRVASSPVSANIPAVVMNCMTTDKYLILD